MPSPGILFLMVLVGPSVIAVAFGLASFRRDPPLLFHCVRCGRDFRRKGHLASPHACPYCRARDWNATLSP